MLTHIHIIVVILLTTCVQYTAAQGESEGPVASCDAGMYSLSTTEECQNCPAGTFKPNANSNEPDDRYQYFYDTWDGTACYVCGENSYSEEGTTEISGCVCDQSYYENDYHGH